MGQRGDLWLYARVKTRDPPLLKPAGPHEQPQARSSHAAPQLFGRGATRFGGGRGGEAREGPHLTLKGHWRLPPTVQSRFRLQRPSAVILGATGSRHRPFGPSDSLEAPLSCSSRTGLSYWHGGRTPPPTIQGRQSLAKARGSLRVVGIFSRKPEG